jgi:protein-S-isoprenylcysteine O-methyltransferase Ste14
MYLKLPPPVVFFLCAGLTAYFNPRSEAGFVAWSFAIVFFLISVGLSLASLGLFLKFRTSPDPHKPEKASTLVTEGIFAYTRNPMYLALVFALLAWSCYWQGQLPYVTVVLLIAYLTYFQILPEERILAEKFSEPYLAYCQKVPRWLII